MIIFGMGMFGSTFLLPLYLQNSMGYTALQSGMVFLPVGILQGSIAPFVGMTVDRINPKIPIFIGISLLALSFYVNTDFSFMSEHHYVMTSLYIRGFGMGMIFTPLNTLSLVSIPREQMAQASSIMNTNRQIGGSLGVAIMSTLLTARTNFHSQVYGQAISAQSEAFRDAAQNMAYSIQQHTGAAYGMALRQSQAIISSHVGTQAFIEGINDDFLIACIITFLGLIPIILMKRKKRAKL